MKRLSILLCGILVVGAVMAQAPADLKEVKKKVDTGQVMSFEDVENTDAIVFASETNAVLSLADGKDVKCVLAIAYETAPAILTDELLIPPDRWCANSELKFSSIEIFAAIPDPVRRQ